MKTTHLRTAFPCISSERDRAIRALLVLAVVAAVLVCASMAYAGDSAKPALSAPATVTAPAPAPAPPAVLSGTHVVVKGKVACRTTANKRNRQVAACSILVDEAKTSDGKPLDALKGRNLHVAGHAVRELERMNGRNVEATGMLINDIRIQVESVK